MEEKSRGKWAVNKNLVMLKLTLFFLYGATSSLMPYLTLHMRSIGLTIEQIALIYLALPFTTFLSPPVTGFLVDKFGQYKPVVIISFVLSAAIHHSLLLIPHRETPGIMPSAYAMQHPNENVELWWSPCPSRECPDPEDRIHVELHHCVDHCLFQNKYLSHIKDDNDGLRIKNMKNGNSTYNKEVSTDSSDTIIFLVKMYTNLGTPTQILGASTENDDDSRNFTENFPASMLRKAGVNFTTLEDSDLRCGGLVQSASYIASEYWDEKCIVQKCIFKSGGPEICPNDYEESDHNTFWIYFVCRFLGTIMMTAGTTIMDPIALTMIEKYGGDFGREKLFSSLGMALFSPFTGILIDLHSDGIGHTDYSAAFYTYDILLIISAFTVFMMPLGTKLPADNIVRDLIKIFKMANVIVFIIFMFILGNLWGFIESFLFLYLKDLGSPTYLLGVTVTVGTVSSMPFLYGADKIMKQVGHVNLIIIAFFAHATRLMGYSFIESPWWCFPFEAMESLSVHLMWVAGATYCALLAPKNLLATLIGVIGMAHFSIGRGSGSFLGGHIIGEIGIRQAFRLMGLIAVVSGSIYWIMHFIWLRKYEEAIYDDGDDQDGEKCEKSQPLEPKFKDAGTMVSMERLSLVVKYNHSITSLGRSRGELGVAVAKARRGSYSAGMAMAMSTSGHGGVQTHRFSASKADLLRSDLEVGGHAREMTTTPANGQMVKIINGGLLSGARNSIGGRGSGRLTDVKTSSAPRLALKSSSLSPIQDQEVALKSDMEEHDITATVDSDKVPPLNE